MTPHEKFTVDKVGELDDGTARLVIDAAIQEALDDCDARAMLRKARTVSVTLAFEPVIDDRGAMKGVEVHHKVRTSLPPREGHSDYLRANVAGDHVSAYLPDARQDGLFAGPRTSEEGNS